jgi:hypothetical protein
MQRRIRFLSLVSLLALGAILAGCQVLSTTTESPVETQDAIGTAAAQTVAAVLPSSTLVATQPPPTEPPPTAEPTATFTPIGALSPMPEPPSGTSTPDPNLNVTDTIVYEDTFDGKSGWFWTFSDDVAEFGAVDGELRISTKTGNNTWRYVLRDNLTAGDMQLKFVAKTSACPGNDEYGILFRGRLDDQQKIHTYIFKLNCSGQVRVEMLDDIDTTVLKDWEAFPAVKTGVPIDNAITIWMAKDQFHFYANDQYLFSLTNSALSEGFFGFYVKSTSNGGGRFVFDDMVVREIIVP